MQHCRLGFDRIESLSSGGTESYSESCGQLEEQQPRSMAANRQQERQDDRTRSLDIGRERTGKRDRL